MNWLCSRVVTFILFIIVAYIAVEISILYFFHRQPSVTYLDDPNVWNTYVRYPASASFQLPMIAITNIRNFSYPGLDRQKPREHYYNRTINVNELKTVSYAYSLFRETMVAAHAWFTFEFSSSEEYGEPYFLSISVEARYLAAERGVSMLAGFFNKVT